jgi:hypothetical protein
LTIFIGIFGLPTLGSSTGIFGSSLFTFSFSVGGSITTSSSIISSSFISSSFISSSGDVGVRLEKKKKRGVGFGVQKKSFLKV